MIVRALLFCVLVAVAVAAPVWLFALCAFVYALKYTAYELVVLAFAIDAFYGFGYPILIPYYTLVTCCVLISLEWIKPHISVYNQ